MSSLNHFWRLTLDTNPEDCNANCIMCEEHSQFSDYIAVNAPKWGTRHRRMPAEWLEPLFQQAKSLGIREVIPSTMGEPLIYRHFDLIVELCHKYKLRLNVTTNGSFPRKPVRVWAEQLVPITSDIKFSWNGATSETYESVMVGLNFAKAKSNLLCFCHTRDELAERGGNYCQVTLQLTFLRNTMCELPALINLAAECGVDRIKGHHLWIHWPDIAHLSYRESAAQITEWNSVVQQAHELVEDVFEKTGKIIRLEGFTTLFSNEKDQSNFQTNWDCPFLGKELWVSPDGRINPCCAPDDARSSLGYFGHFPETSLSQAINSEAYQQLASNYKSQQLCHNCTMRRPT